MGNRQPSGSHSSGPDSSSPRPDNVLLNRPEPTPLPEVSARLLSSDAEQYDVVDDILMREERTWTEDSKDSAVRASNAFSESGAPGGKADEAIFEEQHKDRGSFHLVRAKEIPKVISPSNGNGHYGGFSSSVAESEMDRPSSDGFWTLPRGGYLVETKTAGSIQFGIPPETIKDTLAKGMAVPEVYCILTEMFDRKLGLSKAEFEFPIYYRYFVSRGKATIVTTEAFERRIRVALRETLLGPGSDCNVREDYPPSTPEDALPNFEAEGISLDPTRLKTTIDDVVNFVRYNPDTGASLKGGAITIRPKKVVDHAKGGTKLAYEVTEDGLVLAVVPASVKLRTATYALETSTNGDGSTRTGGGNLDKNNLRKQYEDTEKRRVKGSNGGLREMEASIKPSEPAALPQPLPQFAPFDIPVFGVTMMGASHGFDSAGRTTGFVLWMNRRGIMIDPPPDSSGILEVMGVPPGAIDAVLLTHTHADHDAGTFQRILRTRQIKLYATRTIERSFIRKYAAITGFDEAFLRSMVSFVPIQCGDAVLKLYGGELRFFYSLHTIPCVGFEAYYNGQSLTYSADTRFDPEMVMQLGRDGKIGMKRATQLAKFNFNHTIVLHELGVPPIHTPKEALLRASVDPLHNRKSRPLRDRLFIVHAGKTDKSEFPNQCMDWDTIRIEVEQGNSNRRAEIMSLLGNVPWLEPIGSEALNKLSKVCVVKEFDVGDIVAEFRRGAPSETLYIVMAGVAVEEVEKRAVKPGMSRRTSTFESLADATVRQSSFPVGGLFGEEGLLHALDLTDSTPTLKIPGVPLPAINLPNVGGLLDAFKSDSASPLGSKTLGSSLPARKVIAKSKLFVVAISNKSLLKIIKGNVRHEVHERLKRHTGYPEDERWQCLARNAPIMKLLSQQLAVLDFLACMSEESVNLPEGHVLQDGRSSQPVDFAYVVREGVLRVTPMNAAFSYRGVESVSHDDPYDVGRGTFVVDINAMLKSDKSPFRISVVEDARVFVIPRANLLKVLETYPGLKFQFLDRVHVGWSLEVPAPVRGMDLFGGAVVEEKIM